jgi:hypothetical protein
MGDIVVKALLNYVEKHPEVIEKLIEQVVNKLLEELQKKTN